MLAKRPSGHPGLRLKSIRIALGLTTRELEEYSRRIAGAAGREECFISHSSLSEVESRRKRPPSIYILFTLSVIYGIRFVDLLLTYGIDLEDITRLQMEIQLPQTRLISPEIYDTNRPVSFPVKFDPALHLEGTNLLSRMVETWGEIPVSFIQHLRIKQGLYGFIGMKDFTLNPLIRPGSLVQIDDRETKIQSSGWDTDFDRPIYFLQLRDGYACGWCQLDEGTLSIIPYSRSRLPVRQCRYPDEVDVVGRVVGVAMSLAKPGQNSSPRLVGATA